MSELVSACGCKIHVAQWTSKRKIGSVKQCPLHKAAPELLKAAKAVFGYFETGELCRSTAGDDKSDWAMKQIPVVRALAALNDAIAKAEAQ